MIATKPGLTRQAFISVPALLLYLSAASNCYVSRAAESKALNLTWKQCLRQKPAWYASAEAVRIAANVLLYQRNSGGWPKNIDMAAALTETTKTTLREEKDKTDSTIDNGATTTQLRFLARVFNGTSKPEFKESFLRGLDFLLEAQYPNGGWPQFYPKPRGYHTHITFNDDAMVNVLSLLRDLERRVGYGWYSEAPARLLDVDYPAWQERVRKTRTER